YHMYGVDIDTLNVYILQNGQIGKPVWTRSRNQGNQWLKGQYRIQSVSTYKIVFEGIAGSQGDIGIDDIVVYSSCPQETVRLCTFEDPTICGYQNINSQYKWTVARSDSPIISQFGPTEDHTDGTNQGI
ncbi:unnamed protein product, partial [Didymodactylos carnosus]